MFIKLSEILLSRNSRKPLAIFILAALLLFGAVKRGYIHLQTKQFWIKIIWNSEKEIPADSNKPLDTGSAQQGAGQSTVKVKNQIIVETSEQGEVTIENTVQVTTIGKEHNRKRASASSPRTRKQSPRAVKTETSCPAKLETAIGTSNHC